MRTKIQSLLAGKTPRIEDAKKELRAAVLDGTFLDPQDRTALLLADEIAKCIVDADERLAFWEELDAFIRDELPGKYPGVDFSRGHSLFRRALLEVRKPNGIEPALKLLDDARKEDERHNVNGLASAADRWYRLFGTVYDAFQTYLNRVEPDARNYFFETVGYGWDATIYGRDPDPRIQEAIHTISARSHPDQHIEFGTLATRRYRELFTAAQTDAVVSGLSCLGYLSEWCALAILKSKGVATVDETRPCCGKVEKVPLVQAGLRPLVKAVSADDGSEYRIVGSILWYVWNVRNRLHVGNDLTRADRLEGGLMKVFLHLTDRLLLQTAQWVASIESPQGQRGDRVDPPVTPASPPVD